MHDCLAEASFVPTTRDSLASPAGRLTDCYMPNRLVSDPNRSAHTVYLVHTVPIGFAAWFLAWVGLAEAPLFACTAVFSLAISVAFHELVVRRCALAALLLNGKLPRTKATRSAPPIEVVRPEDRPPPIELGPEASSTHRFCDDEFGHNVRHAPIGKVIRVKAVRGKNI